MGSNYQRFMHAFNELHNVIAKKVNRDPDTNFGELMGAAAKKRDKVIEKYVDEIDFYRELRNLLTHNTINGNEAAAEPSESLIKEIESVTDKIRYSKQAKDLFLKRVRTFDVNDPLGKVLDVINHVRYTQFPVFDGDKLIGILSSIGVTKYLAKAMDKDISAIKKATVRQILEVEDEQDFYEVVPADTSVFDIEEIFSERIREGRTAYVLLIAKKDEIQKKSDLIGIITPWDLPKVVANK
ncbi:Predicted transcriptional regulator with C-terminal CBS domains [Alkalibacterium subtropicum]|uniref:Predicted transcriptional regulator with C-terminal CBS domains n=1 Tax=Alkalibacterium subtropicum TaxID=753702 RepID=A0A1I1H762_9LACT|nr:CBS domain-containing protein [Alkalibacterium subtropicum]SFC16990.1 Predicted transcriptional regulator with C-terminal CBS domains [Alkalibacterium subtropicum]